LLRLYVYPVVVYQRWQAGMSHWKVLPTHATGWDAYVLFQGRFNGKAFRIRKKIFDNAS